MPTPVPNTIRRSLLAEALQLSRLLVNPDQADPPVTARRQARLQELQRELETYAHPICRDRRPIQAIPLAVRQAFVEATVLVTRYHDVGGSCWHGTLASPTLQQYKPDPIPAHWHQAAARSQLCQAFELDPEAPQRLDQFLTKIDQHIDQQQRLIQAVLTSVGIPNASRSEAQAGFAQLFSYLFGVNLPPHLAHGVYTPLQLYLSLPVPEAPDEGWADIPSGDRPPLQRLIQRLSRFSYDQFERFPTFGPCDPMAIDDAWANQIADQANLPVTTVRQSLARSVGVLPQQKAEAFLVHDIWGHHWQLMLTAFDSDYAILADADEPLRSGETAYTENGPLTCGELFDCHHDLVCVDATKARLFFHSEVQQRLGLLFTHLIGELVADAAEFKFIWEYPQAADLLPSSSIFKAHPAKLDLSLADLDFFFLRVLKPLLEVNLSALQPSILEQELLKQWHDQGQPVESLELQTSLKLAIAELYQIFLQEYNAHYLPTLTGHSGVFTGIASNLLYLQNVVNTLYTDFTSRQHPELPFQDLLTVFISRYCSADSYAEFWDIDDMLAAYFVPCWLQLAQP